uniref:Uncharacterized protein n=1 Tax=Ditylenchus dipsaci TaxID=166011 RepID=A0A915DXV1_9BILA
MRDCGLERVLRDLRIFRIFECANDIIRMFVALTGMQYARKHLQQLSNDIKLGSVTSLFSEVKRLLSGYLSTFDSLVFEN